MNHQSAATSMRYIWTAFFFALVIVNSNMIINGQPIDFANVIMTAIIATAATATSVVVWVVTAASDQRPERAQSDEKLKRGQRVERLIELMEPDELHELRQRLQDNYSEVDSDYMLGDDGELLEKRSRR